MLLTVCVAVAGASVVAVAGMLAGLLMLGYAARQRTPSHLPLPSLVLLLKIYSKLILSAHKSSRVHFRSVGLTLNTHDS